jgi:hypothetical protein
MTLQGVLSGTREREGKVEEGQKGREEGRRSCGAEMQRGWNALLEQDSVISLSCCRIPWFVCSDALSLVPPPGAVQIERKGRQSQP